MREYIQPIIFQITSTRSYILDTISAKIGRTPWIVEYVFVLCILYIIALFLLHKIYRFFVISVNKQKAAFLLSCDVILYEFQYQNPTNVHNIDWIKEIIKKGSYQESYEIFYEKAGSLPSDHFLKQLKKTHISYTNAVRRKTICGLFLLIVTLGIYKLFLEN